MKAYIIKHALRNLSRMRTYTIINVIGLIISLAGVIVIARYVHQELTVDSYVPYLDRTFLLVNHGGHAGSIGYGNTEAANRNHIDNWQDPFADKDVECYTRFTFVYGGFDMVAENVHYQVETIIADSMFLRMLPRRLAAGTIEQKKPTDVIITRNLAEKIWPGESAVGKALVHENNTLNVVGVVEQPDTKYNFHYDLIMRDDLREAMYVGWSVVRLKEGADYKHFNKRQKPFSETYHDGAADYILHFQLFPLGKLYFDNPVKDSYADGCKFLEQGNKQNVAFLAAGAIMLLLVGLFNYVNIFSILMMHRRKGIVLRKIFGAKMQDVFWMIFLENFLLASFALGFVWLIISIASRLMIQYYGLTLLPSPCFDIIISLSIVFLLPLAVSVPAAVSHCRPVSVEDASCKKAANSHSFSRNVSLWLQYTFTFFLIVVSAYSIRQLYYMLHTDLGYNAENIVWFDMFPDIHNTYQGRMTDEEWGQRYSIMAKKKEQAEDYMRRINASPLFSGCCYGDGHASLTMEKISLDDWGILLKTNLPGSEYQKIARIDLSPEMIEMYGLKLLEGSKPNAERDREQNYRMYISRSSKDKLGIKDIAQTLIQPMERQWFGFDDNGNTVTGNPPYTIAGVYEDFCMTHLAMDEIPFFIQISERQFNEDSYFLARYQKGKRQETLDFLHNLFEEANGTGGVMPYKFIEDEIAEIYADDTRVARIFATFALLSIFVSCLGLLGISLYDVQQRRREIAIRRVNGAKFKDIFRLIARRYMTALGLAIIIGTPCAIYAIHYYMQGYAHHVVLTPWYFIGAAFLMFLLMLAIIYWQIRKAASENVVDVMRNE